MASSLPSQLGRTPTIFGLCSRCAVVTIPITPGPNFQGIYHCGVPCIILFMPSVVHLATAATPRSARPDGRRPGGRAAPSARARK